MIGDPVVGDVQSDLAAVSPVFEEAAIAPLIVDVHALRQQAGDQVSQGEQPTPTIQGR